MCHVCLCLKVGVHGISGVYQFLDFLKLILDYCSFGFIEVMSVGTYTVRDITEEVKETPTATTVCYACVCRWVPPTKDDAYDKRLEKLHDVKRFMLHHHLVSHTCSNYD